MAAGSEERGRGGAPGGRGGDRRRGPRSVVEGGRRHVHRRFRADWHSCGGERTATVASMHLDIHGIATTRRWLIVLCGLLLFSFVGGCTAAAPAPAATRAMTVYRSPDCSCCHLWADIAKASGWSVATADVIDMAAFKAEHGVPAEAASCHTAVIGEYLIEGHVPLAAVERLLAERPAIDGIALPGMPA